MGKRLPAPSQGMLSILWEWQCLTLTAAFPSPGGEAAGALQGARATIEIPGQEHKGLPWGCWQQAGEKEIPVCCNPCTHAAPVQDKP